MEVREHELPGASRGTRRVVTSLHFGQRMSGRKAYLQASLHADEVPAMLVAHHLQAMLQGLEETGAIAGEVVLVPMANPIGLSQTVQGSHHGRFDQASGINFNRQFQHLTSRIAERVRPLLGADAAINTQWVREAAQQLLSDQQPQTETDALKQLLQLLAVDADIALDLHCDHQACLHVYAGTPQASTARLLAQRLHAKALLLCECSGDDPFDESLSRHWWELPELLGPAHPLAAGCFAATVELRGETDVEDSLAVQDARGLIEFLQDTAHIAGPAATLPAPHCTATPLAGVQPLVAPDSGILVFLRSLGERVKVGDCIAEIVDPASRLRLPVRAEVDGVLFARIARRWVTRGMRLAKIAGPTPYRAGPLLSP